MMVVAKRASLDFLEIFSDDKDAFGASSVGTCLALAMVIDLRHI